ncbi:ABC transporter substrate-binding protein [Sphaerisporangium melleum]|uniref:ABC transporter substrate-binding protein n=1 Tax=Sphaerisporangium melleum TaxID=321316 RepID=A0A917R575_9ACTN|nr:ABC transporter substrate-binding protein [Sphaerisporangium melleum]GGK89705.1 ABC transporter substrate-binding protein [Sphaerisporangium melleum]GII72528.1 ABC transporter substrate-binding protein [Sphaerisporangium melleum]
MAACLIGAAVLLTACGSGGGGQAAGGGASGEQKITLTLNLFGNMGFKELYAKYEAAHPNIKIVERTSAYNDHHRNLAAHLATGRGAGDVEGVDTGFIARFRQTPQHFTDLNKQGAAALKDRWLPWKWEASLARTGEQIGYGTDVGGLALCYRRDLLEKAGLPTGRDEVSKLWPDWAAYFETGKKYTADKPEGTAFFDGAAQIFNAMIGQAPVGFYDTADNVVVGGNPEVRKAYDQVVAAVAAGESAKLVGSTPEWNTGFAKSQFATIACPAWMLAKIQDQAKEFAGKWDIAAIPGGGGNWGGSYLTVPAQGKHVKEAVELIAWLTAPEQQIEVFKTHGILPSTVATYDKPEVTSLTHPFFNDAPIGKIFTTAARNLRPQYQGPRAGDIQTALRDGINRVEQGKQTPEESWQQILRDVDRIKQ